jgi:hypothetical protein
VTALLATLAGVALLHGAPGGRARVALEDGIGHLLASERAW